MIRNRPRMRVETFRPDELIASGLIHDHRARARSF
jgi:hypothetical protein